MQQDPADPRLTGWRPFLSSLLVFVVAVTLFLCLAGPAHEMPEHQPAGIVNACLYLAGVAVLGSCAYWLRENHQDAYGLLEVFAGVIIGVAGVAPYTTGQGLEALNAEYLRSTRTLALLGGMYVVVRGLDNIGKAREKDEKKERIAAWKWYWGSPLFFLNPRKRVEASPVESSSTTVGVIARVSPTSAADGERKLTEPPPTRVARGVLALFAAVLLVTHWRRTPGGTAAEPEDPAR